MIPLSLSLSLSAAPTWGSWGGWSGCSSTCRGGMRSRTRRCVNGNTCSGANIDYEECNKDTPCTRKLKNNNKQCTSIGRLLFLRIFNEGNSLSKHLSNHGQVCYNASSFPLQPIPLMAHGESGPLVPLLVILERGLARGTVVSVIPASVRPKLKTVILRLAQILLEVGDI